MTAMMKTLLCISLIILAVEGRPKRGGRGKRDAELLEPTGRAPYCPGKYNFMVNSTMCNEALDDEKNIITKYGVSVEDIEVILNYHNEKRREVPATNMVKMYWDKELALVAQRWSQWCKPPEEDRPGNYAPVPHDHVSERRIPDWGAHNIGQNQCRGNVNWENCMRTWYEENEHWQYGKGKIHPNSNKQTGHFEQMVNAKAIAVGCGYSLCPAGRGSHTYICNYAYGTLGPEKSHPYIEGKSCEACPNSCNDGLCDCGKELCHNFGTLDPNTCTCTCTSGGAKKEKISGRHCDEYNCSNTDISLCNGFEEKQCYTTVPVRAWCPDLCKDGELHYC